MLGALTLNYFGIISFTLPQAAAIGIIGGADGPTAIYLSGKLAPELLGAIAVAAYSYMALVPLIQPPIMKALTTDKERKIRMVQLRTVSKREKILFPAVLLLLVAVVLNIRYDGEKTVLTTGCAYQTFTMDKSADTAWDKALKKYLDLKGISYEEL